MEEAELLYTILLDIMGDIVCRITNASVANNWSILKLGACL